MITVYGIKNCDTCRKARKWLNAEGVAHEFHDFRDDGLDPATLALWVSAIGWEALVNTRGTTWRNLSPDQKALLATGNENATALATLVLDNPTTIKRPVFDLDGQIAVGFKNAEMDLIRSHRP